MSNTSIVLLLLVVIGVPTVIAILSNTAVDAVGDGFDRRRERRAGVERRLETTLSASLLDAVFVDDLRRWGWTAERSGSGFLVRSISGQVGRLEFVGRSNRALVKVSAEPHAVEPLTGEVLAGLRQRDPSARVRT